MMSRRHTLHPNALNIVLQRVERSRPAERPHISRRSDRTPVNPEATDASEPIAILIKEFSVHKVSAFIQCWRVRDEGGPKSS